MAAEPLSPELVLVSPDLRALALESLPALDPDALFVVAPAAPPPRPPLRLAEQGVVERPRPLPIALAAYLAEALVWGAVRGVAMFAVIAVAAFLLAR